MTRRRTGTRPPPSGKDLYDLLQGEVGVLPVSPDFTDGGTNMVGSFNYLEAELLHTQVRLAQVERQRDAAHELISRSANLYLRYFRLRHRVLLWCTRTGRTMRRVFRG